MLLQVIISLASSWAGTSSPSRAKRVFSESSGTRSWKLEPSTIEWNSFFTSTGHAQLNSPASTRWASSIRTGTFMVLAA